MQAREKYNGFPGQKLPEALYMQLILNHIYLPVSQGNKMLLLLCIILFIVAPLCYISTNKFLHFLADECFNNLRECRDMVPSKPKLNKVAAVLGYTSKVAG